MHTRQNIFTYFLDKKKAPAGKCRQGKKYFTFFLFFRFFLSPGEEFLFITNFHISRKNSYFPYTIFLLEHNKIFSEHNRIFSEHNRVFSHHNRIFSHHNGVFSEHNRILSNHNRVFPEHNEVFREQKYQENGRILHNLALV